MANLLANTTVTPPTGSDFCVAPNCSAIMGRGLLWSSNGATNASAATCKNTVFGFQVANYNLNTNFRNSVAVGQGIAQGFGNATACNASCENVLIGSKAGYDLRSGSNGAACGLRNTMLGHRAGFQTQFGNGNIFVHPFAGFTQGNRASHNIGFGDVAFRGYGVTGNRNIAIGCAAAQTVNNSCSDNIHIGIRSGRYTQYPQLITAVGFGSACSGGSAQQLGVSIGAYTSVSGQCSTVIGKGATGGYGIFANKISITTNCNPWYASGHTIIGNSNTTSAYIATGWSNVSDLRDKTNIQPLSSNLGLPFIKKLRPVKFNWDKRDKYVQKCGFEWGQKDGTLVEETEQYGFIAQEVEEVINELNIKFEALGKHKSQHNENVNVYDLKYLDLVSPMVQSLKDLIEDLENTEVRVEALKA